MYDRCTGLARKDRVSPASAIGPPGVFDFSDALRMSTAPRHVVTSDAASMTADLRLDHGTPHCGSEHDHHRWPHHAADRTGGVAIHLTQSANDSDDPQPAVPSHRWPSSQPDKADAFTNLTNQRWAPRTLCGIRWHMMAGIESTAAGTDDDRTPICRRCLEILDRLFPRTGPRPADRTSSQWSPALSISTAPPRLSACPAINTPRYVAPYAMNSSNDTDTAPRPS